MPIVKHSWLVQDVKDIPAVMKAAFHVASTGRCGPVLVDVPRDIQEAELDFTYPETVDLPGWRPPRKVHPLQIREAAERIAKAEKPVLYVGGGTINGDACDELRALAEVGELPGDHDADGQGRLPRDAPALLRLARDARHEVGEHRHEHVRRPRRDRRPLRRPRHRQADRLRARRDRDPPRHRPGRDLEAPRRRHPRRRPAQEGGRTSSRSRSASTAPRACPAPRPGCGRIEELRDEFPLRYGTGGEWLKPQKVIETLQELTAGDDVIVTTGVGQHQMWAMQYILTEKPRNFITSGGLGTMGYGIPAAIGAKAARPEATVVCVDGDGCFQMTAQELTTAVHRRPADHRRARQQRLPRHGHAVAGHVLRRPPLARRARRRACRTTSSSPRPTGASGCSSSREAELEPALREALALNRTVVIDCRVDPAEQCFPMIPAGAAAIDMVEYQDPVEATS